MFNFLKKRKPEDEVWYSFFKSLYDHCSDIEGYFKVACKQYEYFLEYQILSIPYSYEYEEEIERFRKLPYESMYEILNIIYRKANIQPIDVQVAIRNELSYNFLNVRVPMNARESIYFKIFFVSEDNGKKSYRILHYTADSDTLENYATKIQYMPIDFSLPYSSMETQHFLQAMVALAKYAGTEIPKELEDRFKEITVVSTVNVGDFKRIIELANLYRYDGDIEKEAKNFYLVHNAENPFNETNGVENYLEDFDDSLFSKRFDIVTDYWETDWKFDPEEVEASINDLLNGVDLPIKFEGKWSFTYPQKTYSHHLFPYIQVGLEKIGLNLMNIKTFGDYYVFFLVKTEDVKEILELSEKLALGFEKLM